MNIVYAKHMSLSEYRFAYRNEHLRTCLKHLAFNASVKAAQQMENKTVDVVFITDQPVWISYSDFNQYKPLYYQ